MNQRPTLYFETSVVGYRTSHPSRDIIVLAHQEITRRWWDECLSDFEPFILEIVLEEVKAGDPGAAQERLSVLGVIPELAITQQVEALAAIYIIQIPLPPGSFRDALHIALASYWGVDYLVTWNCKHIASGRVRRRLQEINTLQGLITPIICTPEELFNDTR